jgi:uncharacterized protein YkwD
MATLIALTLMAAAPAAADAPAAISRPSPVAPLRAAVRLHPPPPPAPSPAHQVVALVNAERAVYGLAPLQIDDRLMLAAQLHSDDQAFWSRMSHTGIDGSNVGQRIAAAGFPAGSWAENVAYGYGDPAGVVAAWMNSPGHRENNLSNNTHVGVGLAYSANGTPYWTMDFATPL